VKTACLQVSTPETNSLNICRHILPLSVHSKC